MEFIDRAQQPILHVCLKPFFPATVYDFFFQDNLSQYSKVLRQQEVVMVGRRSVNICYNYSLVIRIVSIGVCVTLFVLLLLHYLVTGAQRHTWVQV